MTKKSDDANANKINSYSSLTKNLNIEFTTSKVSK